MLSHFAAKISVLMIATICKPPNSQAHAKKCLPAATRLFHKRHERARFHQTSVAAYKWKRTTVMHQHLCTRAVVLRVAKLQMEGKTFRVQYCWNSRNINRVSISPKGKTPLCTNYIPPLRSFPTTF